MAFSLRLERFVGGLGIVSLGMGIMFVGFALCLLAALAGIGQFTLPVGGIHKEVGFWSALNWSTTCLILFPLYMVFFALQIDQCALMCRNFSEYRIVVGSNGGPVTEAQLTEAWHTQLQTASKAFWLILFAACTYSSSDWWMSCGKALLLGRLEGYETISWATGILYIGKYADRWPSFAFTIVAYIYHSIALFSYLAALLYSLTLAFFLHQMSTRSGPFRIVFKRELWEHLSGFYRNFYWAILIGLYEAFLIRLEAEYLPSRAHTITVFLTQDWGLAILGPLAKRLLGLNVSGFDRIDELTGKIDNSSWAALGLTGFTLLCLIGVTYLLYLVFSNAKSYFLAKVTDEHWRQSVDVPDLSKAQIEQMRKVRFTETVLTNPFNYGLLILLPLISMTFLSIGLLLVAAIIQGIFLALTTRIRQLSGSRDSVAEAARDGPI